MYKPLMEEDEITRTNTQPPIPLEWLGDNSLTAESELFKIELGVRATFDLYHHDSTMFCEHGVTASDGFCYHDRQETT